MVTSIKLIYGKNYNYPANKGCCPEAYNLYKDNTDGKNADYIPYLTNIDPKLFGISICLMNGEIIQQGDSQYRFGIESVSRC